MTQLLALFAQTARPGGDFSFEDVPAFLLALVLMGVIIGVSQYYWDPERQRERERRQQQQRTPPRSSTPPPPATPAPVGGGDPRPDPPPPHPQELTSAKRRHMIIIGAPGDGKTQAQIALMVGDIARGDQVVWASTNLALFHSRDQQTDLRPIAHRFAHTRDALEIMSVLLWASAEVNRRMPFYHDDLPHGDPIVIYVDELGGLYRQFGDLLVTAMRNIAEQGRKVDVYLALVAHNALKESTGLDMALKPLFQTRLLGNVDQATWTAMVGPGIKLRSVPDGQGLWHMPDRRNNVHEVRIARPTAGEIQDLGRRMPLLDWEPILEQTAPYLARLRRSIEGGARNGKLALALALAAPDEEAGVGAEAEAPDALALVAPTPPPAPPWEPTTLHLQVRELIQAATPEIHRLVRADGQSLIKAQELTQTSNRALARRLGLGQNGGTAAVKVGELIKEWEDLGGVRLFAVPDSPPAARPQPVLERPEREERPERVNAA